MKRINLKKYYYPLYETDTFIDLPDEVADAIEEEHRMEHTLLFAEKMSVVK